MIVGRKRPVVAHATRCVLLFALGASAAGCNAALNELIDRISDGTSSAVATLTPSRVASTGSAPAPKRPATPPPNRQSPAVTRVPPVEAKPAPLMDAASLKGMTKKQVGALLGKPDFRRRDPPAELWRFRGGGCVLDIYFYTRKGGTALDYVEARDALVRQTDSTQCLNRLIRNRGDRRQTG